MELGRSAHCEWQHSLSWDLACKKERESKQRTSFHTSLHLHCGFNATSYLKLLLLQLPYYCELSPQIVS